MANASTAHVGSDDGSSGTGASAPFAIDKDTEFTPVRAAAYTKKEYWDWRFQTEEHHEWLAGYSALAPFLEQHIQPTDKVLLVGCGNSKLTEEMFDAGFANLTSTDISETCIKAMQERHSSSRPGIVWQVADMLDLRAVFEEGAFDVVLDKAALDALLADGGDVWSAPADLLEAAHTVCREAQHVLKPGGLFLSLSFGQPHFRLQYLGTVRESSDEAEADAVTWAARRHEAVDVGFGYFWYIMQAPG